MTKKKHDKWLCASSTIECSAITVLTFYPQKESSSGVTDSYSMSLSGCSSWSSQGFLVLSIEICQNPVLCSQCRASLCRIFLWDSLKWLGGLSPTFPVTCLVLCIEPLFYFILVSITTTGSLFTAQTKCCLSCFLCGGDERRSNM